MKSIIAAFLLPLAFAAPSQAETYIDEHKTIVPHVVYGAGWRNRFFIANYNAAQVSVRLRFFSNNGTAMSLPLESYGVSSQVDVVVPAYNSVTLDTLEQAGAVLYEGYATATFSCSFSPCEDIAVYGVFSTVETPGFPVFEATVPASDSRAFQSVLPFDNRNGFVTGLAVAAHTCTGSTHTFQLRIVRNSVIMSGIDTMSGLDPKLAIAPTIYPFQMSCPGHTSFALPSFITATQGHSGIVIVEDGESNAKLGVVGLLFNPKGGAHTTIPAGERIVSPIIM
jgi:hypothetical protein